MKFKQLTIDQLCLWGDACAEAKTLEEYRAAMLTHLEREPSAEELAAFTAAQEG